MKTIAVFQTHPWGGGRLVVELGYIKTEGMEVEIAAPQKVCWGDGKGGLVENAQLPDGARRIYWVHQAIVNRNHLVLNGAVSKEPGGGALNHVYVDIFFCEDNADMEKLAE